ncbi:hypothetical protein [Streptomyces natalensis]|uniref:hypothetical protein n=1 Tax=Streptomyces natalensis TaxID=68242 RepID=UPI000B0B412D|nr:hypothetical protein [Streptomyces natalensis]
MRSRFDTAEGNREAAANADRYAAEARKAGNTADVEMHEGFAREARRVADDIDRKSS